MVHIKQGTLGPLEEDLFACLEIFAENQRGIGDVFSKRSGIPAVFGQNLVETAGGLTKVIFQEEVLFYEELLQFAGKHLFVDQVHQPDAATADFVFVAGADTATGGSDLFIAAFGFTGNVDEVA